MEEEGVRAMPGGRAFQAGARRGHRFGGNLLGAFTEQQEAGVLDRGRGWEAGDGETEAQRRGNDQPTVARRCQ